MSGLYNMLFGTQRTAPLALAIVGKTSGDFMRFRDAWVELDDTGTPRVAVYTRMGGGNRDHGWQGGHCKQDPARTAGTLDDPDACWGCWVDSVETWPGFVSAADDDFDATYRTFYFQVPEEHAGLVAELAVSGGVAPHPVDMDDRWQAMISSLGSKE